MKAFFLSNRPKRNWKKLVFLWLFLLSFCSPIYCYQYNLGVCAIFQNEAPYLKEWIEFHRMVGVQHFWLYNNNSTDNYMEVLKPYMQKGVVELINWPSPPDEDWTPYQNAAYADNLKRTCGVAKWVAAIDIDEFIVPMHYANELVDVLYNIEKKYPFAGGLMLFWQFFGTSGHWDIPTGKTLVEALIRKAKWDYPGNRHVKSIIRPETVQCNYVHSAIYKVGFGDITLNGGGGPYQPIQIDPIRIHHYFPRTEKYLREIKIPRRQRYERQIYSQEDIERIVKQFDLEFNEVEDTAIMKYVPLLRKRLGMDVHSVKPRKKKKHKKVS